MEKEALEKQALDKQATEKNAMEERTIDDIINTVGGRPNVLMVALATWAMALSMVGALCAYMIQFTGFIPWQPVTCLTQHCSDALNETSEMGPLNNITFHYLCLKSRYDLTAPMFAIEMRIMSGQCSDSPVNLFFRVSDGHL